MMKGDIKAVFGIRYPEGSQEKYVNNKESEIEMQFS